MKIILLRKRVLLIAALLLFSFPFLAREVVTVQGDGKGKFPIYSVETEEKKVAVTFNSAWGNEDIDMLLKVLGEKQVKCTFFLLGEWAEKYPDSAKKILAAGHEIGSHGYRHVHYKTLSDAEILEDLQNSAEAIEKAAGIPVKLVRAPYGEYDGRLWDLCRSIGQTPIQWDVDSLDWQGLSGEEMKKRIEKKIQNGSVLLFHTGTAQTAENIGGILDFLKSEGYMFSTVGDLIYTENYTVNHAGRQFPKASPY